jgi:hypothetical protein
VAGLEALVVALRVELALHPVVRLQELRDQHVGVLQVVGALLDLRGQRRARSARS